MVLLFFFFKQKTAYGMRISDWSSDVCSSDLLAEVVRGGLQGIGRGQYEAAGALGFGFWSMQGYVVLPQALRSVVPAIVNAAIALFKDTTYVMVVGLFDLLNIVVAGLSDANWIGLAAERSEEPTSALQSLMRTSYAVFCL